MSQMTVGQRAFSQRPKYPLTELSGTRNYVFYFVGPNDPYGEHARHFIRQRYSEPKHHAVDVGSFEALFAHLKNDIAQHNLTHVREIIIVAHATAEGLITPLVSGASNTHLKKYKCTCARSLNDLRGEIATQFPTFAANRTAVLARITDQSWVTLRACNFGQSRSNMYALYAFFGGRANLYAPRIYQFFGEIATGRQRRFETKLDVHQHFVKQGYLEPHVHTPERADAIVDFLVEQGRASDPIELFDVVFPTPPANAPPPPPTAEMTAFDAITARLDQGTIPAALAVRLQQVDITLTSTRAVKVKVEAEERRWRIYDTIVHAGVTYEIEYDVYVETRQGDHWVMSVQSTLRVPDASDVLHEQLFITVDEKRKLQGLVGQFAGYAEGPNPDGKANYDALVAVLDPIGLNPSPVPADINELMSGANVELPDTARIKELPATTIAGRVFRTWQIDAVAQYLIKIEHPLAANAAQAHTISAFEHWKDDFAAVEARQVMLANSGFGASPDRPGTELMSYLDSLPIDTLAELVDYLRAAYKPENAVYIHQAVQAIDRKYERDQWLAARPDYVADPAQRAPLYEESIPYTRIKGWEKQDLKLNAYDFIVSNYWEEVKASKPPPPQFQIDLFTEHPFSFTSEQLQDCSDLEVDSPSSDVLKLRSKRPPELQKHMQRSKDEFVPNATPSDPLGCERFQQLVDLMKSLQGKSLAEVQTALDNFTPTPGGASWSITDLDWTQYGIPKPIGKIHTVWRILGGKQFLPDDVISKALRWAEATYEGTRFGRVAAFLRAAKPYYTLALLVAEMFKDYLATYADALQRWENKGKLVAIRAWADGLYGMTTRLQDNFPTSIHVDLGTSDSELQHIYDVAIGFPVRESFNVIMDMDRFRKGFDEGKALIEKEANEVVLESDRIIDAVLAQDNYTPCMIRILRESGLIDPSKSRALVMRQYAETILDQLPKP
jgi:hypothetical protein